MVKDRAWNDLHPKVQATALVSGGAYLAVVAAVAALSAVQKERKGKIPPMISLALTAAVGLLGTLAGYLKGDYS